MTDPSQQLRVIGQARQALDRGIFSWNGTICWCLAGWLLVYFACEGGQLPQNTRALATTVNNYAHIREHYYLS